LKLAFLVSSGFPTFSHVAVFSSVLFLAVGLVGSDVPNNSRFSRLRFRTRMSIDFARRSKNIKEEKIDPY